MSPLVSIFSIKTDFMLLQWKSIMGMNIDVSAKFENSIESLPKEEQAT